MNLKKQLNSEIQIKTWNQDLMKRQLPLAPKVYNVKKGQHLSTKTF